MRVLAIDPGPAKSAYVIWDGERISEKGIVENSDLLRFDRGLDLDYCAIEMIASYGKPVGQEVFSTCVWVGRAIERWREYTGGIPHALIFRKEVCVHLCNSARAGDPNIRRALIDRLGAPGTKASPGVTYGVHKDEWAALAVAVTAFDRIRCGIYGDAA